MRVLVVSHLFPNTRVPYLGRYVADQIEALRHLGVQTDVVVPTPYVPLLLGKISSKYEFMKALPPFENRPHGKIYRVRHLSFPRNRAYWINGLSLSLGLRQLAKILPHKYDLIHAYNVVPDGYAALALGKVLGLPVVTTSLGSDINVFPFLDPLTHRQARRAISESFCLMTVSDKLRRNALSIATPNSTRVVHCGIDLELFQKQTQEDARAYLGLPYDKSIVLFTGNLLPIKGVDILIRAFSRVATERADALLVLVGDGPMKSDLITMCSELGISHLVRFAGPQAAKDIPLWMTAANMLAVPSRNEGLGIVLLEAMASARPVVASNIGGIPEAVVDGQTGILVKSEDILALAQGILLLLNNEPEQKRMGDNGAGFALNFTWQENAERTLAVFNQAIY